MKKIKARESYHATYKWSKKGRETSVEVVEWIINKFRLATNLIIEATGMYKYFDTITFDFTKDCRRNEK